MSMIPSIRQFIVNQGPKKLFHKLIHRYIDEFTLLEILSIHYTGFRLRCAAKFNEAFYFHNIMVL